jgi:hypothetical protein
MATMENRTVYQGVNMQDSNDRITLSATTERAAKVEMLDQLGYIVVNSKGQFFLQDADDQDSALIPIKESKSMDDAHDKALKSLQWKVDEPMELIGGSVPTGMGYDDEQNGW